MPSKANANTKPSTRRPYAPPRLVVHGTVAQVTALGGGGDTDGKGGSEAA